MLGLPDGVRACLFDLDGVLTQTAKVHAAAWKEMCDAYLKAQAQAHGQRFAPFEQDDYDEYVDGKPREDGVNTPASEAAVFEDAVAGVAAGRAGGFGFVVGVDRVGHADQLREHGASVVVKDLAELLDTP